MENKFVVAVIVPNHFGVLYRLAGLFSKKCYNIESIAAGVTENPKYTRITIQVTGDKYVKDQVVNQLKKMHDVEEITVLDDATSIMREHLIIKFGIDNDKQQILKLISKYSGRILYFDEYSITAEFTIDKNSNDLLSTEARQYNLLESCRSGLISLANSYDNLLIVKDENN
jgi:acetolactate synthase-1/3 small subunit